MENSAIIVAVIAAVASIFGAVFTFFSSRYNSKTSKTTNILEEQYLKVISPIHEALNDSNIKHSDRKIESIIENYYQLLPDQLFSKYTEYIHIENRDNSDLFSTDFGQFVDRLNKAARAKLGYSKIKVTKEEKETGKLLADVPSSMRAIIRPAVLSILMQLTSALIATAVFYNAFNNKALLLEVVLCVLGGVILECILIILLFSYYNKY